MSTTGVANPPIPVNEPVRSYAPGSRERARIEQCLARTSAERMEIPLVIAGKDVYTGKLRPAVMPHEKDHVLADVHQGGPGEVQLAIDAAARAWLDSFGAGKDDDDDDDDEPRGKPRRSRAGYFDR